MADFVVGGIVVLAVVLAIRKIIKDKKSGKGCCGSYGGCSGDCNSCKGYNKKNYN